eukprot:9411909-Pyramimonas_sp.AAC.1
MLLSRAACSPESRSSGVGNTFSRSTSVTFTTWNTRALCPGHYRAAGCTRQLQVLSDLAASPSDSPPTVLPLQETHGGAPAIEGAAQRAGLLHHLFASCAEEYRVGGVATLIP